MAASAVVEVAMEQRCVVVIEEGDAKASTDARETRVESPHMVVVIVAG